MPRDPCREDVEVTLVNSKFILEDFQGPIVCWHCDSTARECDRSYVELVRLKVVAADLLIYLQCP
jgi:hypothetical protein